MSLLLDRPDNATVRHDAQGIVVHRKALISKVGGPVTQRVRAALQEPGLPRYGDAHPAWPDLRVVDIALRPVDVQTWDGTIVYREPRSEERAHMLPVGSVVDVSWFSVTLTEERSLDINGERMIHIYSGWPDIPTIIGSRLTLSRSLGLLTAWKSETAERQLPLVGVRVLLTEGSPPSTRLKFVSTVNGAYWSGYPPKTWLFTGPVSGSEERGRWLNTYELLYKPDTWQLKSIVEVSGAPPSNATLGNGIAFFDIYPTSNFGQLGFGL